MENKIRITGIFVLILSAIACTKTPVADYSNGNIMNDWENNLTEAIMVDLFSPPVASRIYAYCNVAAYEVMRHTEDTPGKSLAGVLNDLNLPEGPEQEKQINYYIAGITAFSGVARTMVYSSFIINEYEKAFVDSIAKTGVGQEVMDASLAYGNSIGQAIVKYASRDHFKQTRGMLRHELRHTVDSWEPTPPDFMEAAEPNWEKISPFVIDSASQFRPDSLAVPFSLDPESSFYQENIKVMNAGMALDSNQFIMSIYWDDNPGVSAVDGHLKKVNKKMTPGGHWMAITGEVIRQRKSNMAEATKLLAVTSVAIADAFIACWDAKYHYDFIRPVTYINRHIKPDWKPLLQTPAFPEFPSGHATISAAAAQILTKYAGDNFAFTDSSEFRFGLPVRSFASFMDAAHECAASRFYGGIHFMPSNLAGTAMGIKVSDAIIKEFDEKLN